MTCAIRRACNTTTNTTGADLIEGEQLQSSTQDQRAESPSSNHDKGSSEEDPDRPSLNTGDRAMDSGTCETSSDDRTCVKCGGVNEPLQTVLCGSCKDPYHSICVGRGGTTLTERWLCSNCDSCGYNHILFYVAFPSQERTGPSSSHSSRDRLIVAYKWRIDSFP